MKTEPWWVCGRCDKPVAKAGRKGVHLALLKHRTTCHPLAGFWIKQIEQQKRKHGLHL